VPQKKLENPKSVSRRLFASFMGGIGAAYLFIAIMLANSIQISSVVFLPFSKKTFRAINRMVAGTWWGSCVVLSKWMNGTKIEVTGDVIPKKEKVLAFTNHQDMPDIAFMLFLSRSHGSIGNLKFFVKDIIKYIPGIGWGMLFLDCVFLKRNWTADFNSINNTFAKLRENDIPFWFMIFAEGTRITPKKLSKTNEIAKNKGKKPLRHVLLPRTRGFSSALIGLGEQLEAVYDVTIGYPQGVPSIWQYVCGYIKTAHVHVRRYPASELLKDHGELANWLEDRFYEKDELLDNFYKNGKFD